MDLTFNTKKPKTPKNDLDPTSGLVWADLEIFGSKSIGSPARPDFYTFEGLPPTVTPDP